MYYLRKAQHFLRYEIRHFLQRMLRGYSDADLHNLDYFLAKRIIAPLKAFKSINRPTPRGFSPKEWESILDKMIYSLETIGEDSFMDQSKEKRNSVQEGLELLGKHFHLLWS